MLIRPGAWVSDFEMFFVCTMYYGSVLWYLARLAE
jgi:hypothetical protein